MRRGFRQAWEACRAEYGAAGLKPFASPAYLNRGRLCGETGFSTGNKHVISGIKTTLPIHPIG
jgi:hypothetical protein